MKSHQEDKTCRIWRDNDKLWHVTYYKAGLFIVVPPVKSFAIAVVKARSLGCRYFYNGFDWNTSKLPTTPASH